ncbi:MAG: hypothetical protein WD534_03555 [Phycisphaeraceae bacterium]
MSLITRFHNLPAAHPADELRLARGRMADYAALAEHHYRADRPATALRVLVLRSEGQSLAARYVGRREAAAAVAVLVESLPSLSCKLRDWALHDRYGTWLSPTARARMLNDEVRCISRVVVHPQWRGLGLAVRLVRAALREPETPFTEALAAMGRVNPFFERAGMTAYHRPRHACDARLIAALERVGLSAADLATLKHTWRCIERQPAETRQWLVAELHRWFRRNGGRGAKHERDPREQLRAAQQRLLLAPVYYLHDNRGSRAAEAARPRGVVKET